MLPMLCCPSQLPVLCCAAGRAATSASCQAPLAERYTTGIPLFVALKSVSSTGALAAQARAGQ